MTAIEIAVTPAEAVSDVLVEPDRLLPRGHVQTHGGWILYIGDNRVWEKQNGRPYPAKVGAFEVTVLSEMKLVGSERLHLFNIEGFKPLGTQVILAEYLDIDIIRRL